ncbi:helix-turn-helix transcriptional regulator [Jiella sp. MQZ9-1]|uniref:Helix-turn-helix transcriptional regulator n=1 Tax=Jiella flava TaxID=2816857 RepID=A0A939JTF5_9HYPH|nr:helix-turn-helix transcriptional regulator [Jiella flava]MBO0663948.1 helix-turn-helix transcriptional regulator [Jiella flava]MCD2472519.1 helix-turn-helix transcriptional regulator [Jiella flava]
MFSHDRIWAAIDALAARNNLSASGLARRAGLDPTTFNRSKRSAGDGRPRWPSTESIAKVIEATGSSIQEFTKLMAGQNGSDPDAGESRPAVTVPLLGFAQAGHGGFFDDAGFPVGQGWDEIQLPAQTDETAYALEVSGQSMMPLYRDGDVIIVAPGAAIRRGDRVVVRTRGGEVMAKILQRQTARTIELASVNPDYPDRQFALDEIEWMARILWASQ